MAKNLIVVTGITGMQGGSVARHFLKHADWSIRGITRNPATQKAKDWAAKGVDIVQGDFADVSSLEKAFQGARAIFAVTDYMALWTQTSESDDLKKKAAAKGQTINEFAGHWETEQGINIANAASHPSVLSTLEKYIFSTLTGIKKASGGKYFHAHQFDSKGDIEEHIRTKMPELNRRLSTVNMGAYQENAIDPEQPTFTPHKADDGSYYFIKLKTDAPHKTIPELWTYKDAGAVVEALVRSHPPGTDVLGSSEILTKDEYAEKWGRVVGKKAFAKALTDEELRPILPEGFEDEVFEWFHFFPEYGYTGGNDKVKSPEELGIKTTPLEEFFKQADWSRFL